MLRYIDEKGQELATPDYGEGTIWPDYMVEQEFDASEDIKLPALQSYICKVVFTDGTSYDVDGPDDEHIKNMEFVPFGDYADKEIKSYVLRSMLSLENWGVLKERPWVQFRRFISYTEEEKEQMQEDQEEAQERNNFLANGPEMLTQLKDAMGNLSKAFTE